MDFVEDGKFYIVYNESCKLGCIHRDRVDGEVFIDFVPRVSNLSANELEEVVNFMKGLKDG